MSPEFAGLVGMVALFALLAIRVPVAYAMIAVGLVGMAWLNNPSAALSLLSTETFTVASSIELVVIPLFILMGNVATEAGLSRKLYDAAYAWIGSIRGGLASATVLGCAGFAALSGSSVATALTMGRVSLGEMERYGYNPRLSTGAVAAGGTLGILIPPSTGFVIYAILTQQSIGRLFLAGILPGLLLTFLFVALITIWATIRPDLGPSGPRTSFAAKLSALAGALPIILLIVVTIGGIYLGIFSPVEASAVGATLAILMGLGFRTLTPAALFRAVRDTVGTTATVMLIIIAANIMNPFLALTHIPLAVGNFLTSLDIGAYGILVLIICSYLVLGCFLEGFAMLVLTMPIFFPVIVQLGFDPIWFGVIVVLSLEMGLITPPVGVNVYIVKSLVPHVPIGAIFAGVFPFLLAMVLAMVLLTLFPEIVLYLPRTMIG